VLLTFFLLYLLFNLISGTLYLPKRIELWWQNYQQRGALKKFTKGCTELITGKEKRAEKNLLKSARNTQLSFVSFLIAAIAANRRQATDKRDKYLVKAKSTNTKQNYAVDVIAVQFYLRNHQPEKALKLLSEIRKQSPKDRYTLKLLAQTYIQLKDWEPLQQLLRKLKKYKIFEADEYSSIEKDTYFHLLTSQYFTDFSQVQTLWNKVPHYLQHDPDVLIAYCEHLKRWNRGSEAEELIRKELKKKFDSQLLEYFVTTHSKKPTKQIALGEKYLKNHSDDPTVLVAMGLLCLRNRLWGQARDYLERSLKLQPTPETYSALGYVYEKLGESTKALHYYRKGLKYLGAF
jgi:HemY protein